MRTQLRAWVVMIMAVIIISATAAPASAHVRVSSEDAAPGGYGVLTFRVPTESETASTTAVIVDIPADTVIASVSVEPKPGWSATLQTEKLDRPVQTGHGELDQAVRRISWRADSPKHGIKPGEFARFSVSAGPLPEVETLAFPTVQRYSDGTEVAWDEISTDPNAEPEHPAPVLDLAAAGDPGSATDPAATDRTGDDHPSAQQGSGWLAPAAAVLAGLALIIALIALLRTLRPGSG